MIRRRAFVGLGAAGLVSCAQSRGEYFGSTAPPSSPKLADCERRRLRAMPVLPQYVDVWAYLQEPFVRGLTSNLFDIRAFKYVRIDRNWKPS